MQITSIIILAIALTGCGQYVYKKKGATSEQVNQIIRQCEYEGLKHANWNRVTGGTTESEIAHACMDMNGVKRTRVE